MDPYSLNPSQIKGDQMLDEHEISALKEKVKKVHSLLEQHKKQDFFSYHKYYIVSVRWLERWKVYCSFEEMVKEEHPTKYMGLGELPELNEDIAVVAYKSDIHFEGQLQRYNYKLKPGLQEGRDYIFMTQAAWAQFENSYPNIPIERCVVETKVGKKVELYYQDMIFVPISQSILSEIELEKRSTLLVVNIQFSHYSTVQLLLDAVRQYMKQFINTQYYRSLWKEEYLSRLWLAPQNKKKHNLFHTLREGSCANSTYEYKLYLDAVRLDVHSPVNDYDILDDSLLILEMVEPNKNWIFFDKHQPLVSTCELCRKTAELKYLCSCKHASYCSKSCKRSHKTFHSNRCPNNAESQSQEEELGLNVDSRRGVVGLRNLGNTCFMNSGLQCVSHIYDLTQYFLNNKYIEDINNQNVLGTQGELCMAYAKMLRNLWYGCETSFSPTQVKRAIGKFQPMFSGYQQHDSGELITYLLDGLHEDLNRVKKKPYVELKDSQGRPDEAVARQQWNYFLMRNRSQIVDNMYGQYRSVVICPKCEQKSITFDPFCMCSLPVTNTSHKKLEVTYVHNHLQMTKLDITYQKSWNWKMSDILAEVRNKVNSPQARLIAYINSYYDSEIIQEDTLAENLRKQHRYQTVYVRQLGDEEETPNHSEDICVSIKNTAIDSYYKNEHYRRKLSSASLYFFSPNITLKQLHHKILKYFGYLQPDNFKITEEDYQTLVINEKEDSQPLRILAVPAYRYGGCCYCTKNGCDGCPIPYSTQITLKQYVKGCNKYKVELELYWRKSVQYIQRQIDKLKDVKDNDAHQSSSKGQTTLNNCFELFQQAEVLAEDNAWYCPRCKDFVLGHKQMQIYKAPKVLILCLKRFKRKHYYLEKNSMLIDFPIENFDISPYLIHSELPSGDIEQDDHHIVDQQGPVYYDLFAICNHFGGTGGGHYTAYCKNPITAQWHDFDDSYVSEISKNKQLVSESAYILFYKRKG